MVNRTHINSAQSIYIFFLNITRRQAISPVAKFHHVLGRSFMIQQWTEALKFNTLQFHVFIMRWSLPEMMIEAESVV